MKTERNAITDGRWWGQRPPATAWTRARLRAATVAGALLLAAGSGLPPLARAQPPAFAWAVKAGGTSGEIGTAIAVDGEGASYITGSFSSTNAVWGAVTLTNRGANDMFLAKYTSAGELVWVRQAGGAGDEGGNGVALDASGNVLVTGYFFGTASFGNTSLVSTGTNGSADIFVAKFDNAGNLLWVKQAGGPEADAGSAIAVDGAGNSYVAGYYQGTARFDAITLTNGVASDLFVAKYDPAGNVLWARQAGGDASDIGRGVALDGAANCYVTGLFYSTNAVFGSVTLTNTGTANTADIFVAKYDRDGALLWATKAGGTANDNGLGIGVDGAGACRVAGFFASTNAAFGALTVTNQGGSDIFLAKYDSAGTVLWVSHPGGSGTDLGRAVSVDLAGESYLAGQFSGPVAAFDGLTLTNAGSSDLFAAKYDNAGNVVWVVRGGGAGSDNGLAIGRDATSSLYLTGGFSTNAVFGAIGLASSGIVDVLVTRLGASPPALSIGQSGGQVILRWPASAASFNLESLERLANNNLWSPVTGPIGTVGDQMTFTNTAPAGSRFFRLRSP